MYQCRKARKQGWGKTPLIWLLERDGSFYWLSHLAAVAITTVCGYMYSSAMSPIIVPWVLTLMSIMGCRIILNIQHLADEGEDHKDVSEYIYVELTTNIQSDMAGLTCSHMDIHLSEALEIQENNFRLRYGYRSS